MFKPYVFLLFCLSLFQSSPDYTETNINAYSEQINCEFLDSIYLFDEKSLVLKYYAPVAIRRGSFSHSFHHDRGQCVHISLKDKDGSSLSFCYEDEASKIYFDEGFKMNVELMGDVPELNQELERQIARFYKESFEGKPEITDRTNFEVKTDQLDLKGSYLIFSDGKHQLDYISLAGWANGVRSSVNFRIVKNHLEEINIEATKCLIKGLELNVAE